MKEDWIKLRTVHDMTRAPELINQQFINRIDLKIEFRQQINRFYPVFNFDAAPTVVGGPYEYGVPGAVHGVFKGGAEVKSTPAGSVAQPTSE